MGFRDSSGELVGFDIDLAKEIARRKNFTVTFQSIDWAMKEKELNAMRAALKVGDSIVSIGGICGKVVRVKDDTVVIQVGADKVKFELTRWAISQVVSGKGSKLSKETDDEKSKFAARPRRLKKAEKEDVVDVEVEPATPENADEN